MVEKEKKREKLLLVLSILLIVFLFVYIFIISYSVKLIRYYKNRVLPYVYIGEYNISNLNTSRIKHEISKIEQDFKKQKIKFKANSTIYEYNLEDLGISIDQVKLKNDIDQYLDGLTYSKRINQIFKKKKKVFSYQVIYSNQDIKTFMINLKGVVDQVGNEAKLIVDNQHNLTYQSANPSYTMDIDQSYQRVISTLEKGFNDLEIELVGNGIDYQDDENLRLIDTKISSYSTRYNAYIARGRNVEASLRFLNGTIVKSGEEFSYFKVAGPYNKKGYVFYDDAVGNGTCQIASTIYNTTLLSGVQITQRYQHQHQMTYVPPGQDATVVSSGNRSLLDFKFKNTHQYPIYISAYYGGGIATIEFWSNHDAKEGKEYTVSYTSLGNNTYQTYLHTWQNGIEIASSPIARSHYTIDQD